MTAAGSPATPGASPDTVVAVTDLSFSYGGPPVLQGLGFTIGRGQVVGLLGPNGAGKSTTIKILCGILPPGGGTVRIAGCAMPAEAVEAKKRIGYVPEAAGLFETLSGQEFLELIGRLQDVPEETLQLRIASFLEQFDLTSNRLRRRSPLKRHAPEDPAGGRAAP